MEFHFLGTGAGVPSLQRNVSSLAIRFLQEKGVQWLFDCGEATQHQMMKSAISPSKIDRVFITHLHGDHIYGLPGFLGTRSFQGATSPLTVYGPAGLESFIKTALTVSGTYLRYDLDIIEIYDGQTIDAGFATVSVCELKHTIESYGFRIKEKDKAGELDVGKLQALQVPPGPIYQKIKLGQTVMLEDGRSIDGTEFIGPTRKGRVVVIAGDTQPTESMVEFANDADVLVHEATFRSGLEENAHEFGHSTIQDAASVATRANIRQLILTHISSRYLNEEEAFTEEAITSFKQTWIATDLSIFHLERIHR
ncbi:ribonuclease Z [Alkalicoccobacillus gibsonii]|uniref:ribonuclease Z n=1 Tax=Alkalicoccobacillus gibsonii TaxID=79881 RepID=UPI003F7BE69A